MFYDFCGPDLLGTLACSLSPDSSNNWRVRLRRHSENSVQAPLHHLLLIQFLGFAARDFFATAADLAPRIPFQHAPWPCLNPAGGHTGELTVPAYSLHFSDQSGLPVGTGKHRPPLATYLDYAPDCARQGLKPVSERTFARRIREYVSNPDNRPSKGPQHRFGENAQPPSMIWKDAVERFFQGANKQFVRTPARPFRFHTRHITCAVANGKPTRLRPRFSIGTERVEAQRTLLDEG